jgi:integrase
LWPRRRQSDVTHSYRRSRGGHEKARPRIGAARVRSARQNADTWRLQEGRTLCRQIPRAGRGTQTLSPHLRRGSRPEGHSRDRHSARRVSHEDTRATIADYAAAWIDSYQGRSTRGFRESTRAGYRRSIDSKVVPFFRKRGATLAQLEPQDVRAFIVWLFDEKAQKRRLAVSTVRGHVAALRAMLATAVEDGLLRHNPAAGVRISRPGSPTLTVGVEEQRRALDSDELTRFLGACEPEWRVFFELLAMTGVRISEAIELRWRDIDFGAKRLRVRRQCFNGMVAEPKSRHGKRDIPLSTTMARTLWATQGAADSLIFTGPRGNRIDRAWVWRNVLKPAAKAAGVPWAGFHTFRHTCASILFANGRNPKVVQMWLGHSDPGFTLRTYVHLIDDGMGDADFLDDAVRITAEGHMRATRATETQANDRTALEAKCAI